MSGRLLRGTESVRNHRRVPLRNNGIEFGGREYLYFKKKENQTKLSSVS